MYGIKHTEPEEPKESCKQQRINAVARNLHQFQDLVYSENMDVVCVNETWLKESIDNSEILQDNYITFREDRSPSRAGGVLIASKNAALNLYAKSLYLNNYKN